jgi:hypothetical protein
MKTRQTEAVHEPQVSAFPDDAELAALRNWYAGVGPRDAVERYLGHRKSPDTTARRTLGRIRRQLVTFAESRHRPDLAAFLVVRPQQAIARSVARAIDILRWLPEPEPQLADAIDMWLSPRIASALLAHDIRTLADLTVRVHRRRRWWTPVKGLGAAGAAHQQVSGGTSGPD